MAIYASIDSSFARGGWRCWSCFAVCESPWYAESEHNKYLQSGCLAFNARLASFGQMGTFVSHGFASALWLQCGWMGGLWGKGSGWSFCIVFFSNCALSRNPKHVRLPLTVYWLLCQYLFECYLFQSQPSWLPFSPALMGCGIWSLMIISIDPEPAEELAERTPVDFVLRPLCMILIYSILIKNVSNTASTVSRSLRSHPK